MVDLSVSGVEQLYCELAALNANLFEKHVHFLVDGE